MKSHFFLSIMIPTMGRSEPLEKCLESLLKQTYKNFEVVVIDGEKKSPVSSLIKKFSKNIKFKYDVQKEKGIVAAIQQGFDLAEGEFFLRTDDDIVATPNWLEEIVKTFAKDKKIAGVTGPTSMPKELHKNRDLNRFIDKMKNGEDFFWKLVGKFYFNYLMEGKPFVVGRIFKSGALSVGGPYYQPQKKDKEIIVDYLESCNWTVKRNLILKLGGFDANFSGVGEYFENDTTTKIKKMDYKLVFNPKAQISHHPSKAGVFSARGKTFGRIMNFQRYYFRHIRPNNLDKIFRFLAYLAFQNAYYTYMFFTTKQKGYLESYPASIFGIIKGIFGRFK